MSSSKSKIIVSLYLKGLNLNPTTVSKILDVDPTRAQRKGETWETSSGRIVTYRIGMWSFCLESDEGNLSDLINQILEVFKGKEISLLDDIEESYWDIFLAKDVDKEGATFTSELSPDFLTMLAEFGLPVRLTFAAVNP